jgi:hypothetical protein
MAAMAKRAWESAPVLTTIASKPGWFSIASKSVYAVAPSSSAARFSHSSFRSHTAAIWKTPASLSRARR